jgi:hypothetical protein
MNVHNIRKDVITYEYLDAKNKITKMAPSLYIFSSAYKLAKFRKMQLLRKYG